MSLLLRASLVGVVASLVAGASGCGVNPADTQKMWRSVQSSLGKTSGGSTQQQALSVGINFDVDCAEGGTASLTAKLDVDTDVVDATNALFGYDVAYDACKPDENTLDGQLHYAAAVVTQQSDTEAGVTVDTVYQGHISSSGESNGTCDVDVTGHIAAAAGQGPGDEFQSGVDVEYSGTICGHDAHEVLQASSKVDGSASP